MNPFSVETWIKFDDGISVCFRSPKAAEMAWAMDVMARVKKTDPDTPEFHAIVGEEIPHKLAAMATNAKLPEGAELPPNWKDSLKESSLIMGYGALEVLNALCFRSHVKPAGEGKA